MAQIFALNGTALTYVTKADWIDAGGNQGLDGPTPLERWRRHVWRAPEGMTASEFNSIYALEGQKVSLTTTNYSDRNGDYVTYYGADLERARGRHSGPAMIDVVIDFLVRV